MVDAELEWPVEPVEALGKRNGTGAWLEYALGRTLLELASRVPRAVLDPLISALARVAKTVDREHSNAARALLRQALGEMPEQELEARVVQAWRVFLQVAVESVALPRVLPLEEIPPRSGGDPMDIGKLARFFDVEMCAEAQAIARERRGGLIVSAHVGSWEAYPALVARQGFHPLYVVGKPPKNRPFSRYLQQRREHLGVRQLSRHGAMRDAPKVVQAGGIVGLMLDQRARKKPVVASFFGRPAFCERSVGVLVRRTDAPVLFGACYRTEQPWHFRIEVPKVLPPEVFKGLTPEETAERINRELERMILRAPEQYFWLHDRYRGVPATP
jgi:lauroyl/myristoyl acyltransferase